MNIIIFYKIQTLFNQFDKMYDHGGNGRRIARVTYILCKKKKKIKTK